jgi:predicted HTH transcriptional regulator
LHCARVIEHWGTGTIRILRACETEGMPHPEFMMEQGMFKVRFPGLGQRLFLDLTELPERQRRAVAHVQEHGKITTQEYSHLVRVSERTARNDLNEMVALHILERRGRSSIICRVKSGQFSSQKYFYANSSHQNLE